MIVLLKLGLSALFGLVIGFDREVKKKPLGLKTCLVLAVSSCLLTIVSIQSAYDFPKNEHTMMDPLRLAAQIVSGVGFIGAGVILKRSNDVISGLTTAAMIWGASGIGIAIGAGFYREASAALIIILIGVDVIPRLLKKLGPAALRHKELNVSFTFQEMDHYDAIIQGLKERHILVRATKLYDLDETQMRMEVVVQVNEHRSMGEVYRSIRSIDQIAKLDIRSFI